MPKSRNARIPDRPKLESTQAQNTTATAVSPQLDDPFHLLVDSVIDYAIFMLDTDGNIVSWNRGAARIKGYSKDEIIGRHFSIFYTPEDLANGKPVRALRQARDTGRFEDEGWRMRKDGTRFWASVILTPIVDSTGTIRNFAKVTRDLTDRKRMEEELRRSEEIFHRMVDAVKDYGIFLLSPEGLVSSWNAGAERIYGYTAKEIIGQHFSRFYPAEKQAEHHPERELERATADGKYMEEGWRYRKDGKRFWAAVVITPVLDERGELRGHAKITRDMTEYKHQQDRIIEQNRELEAFAYSVAHDLRAPVRHIDGFCRMLEEDFGAQLPAGAKEHLATISQAADEMGTLIDELLNLSRISRQRIRRAPADLGALARQTVAALAGESAGRVVEWKIGKLPVMAVDAGLLRQVYRNLLSNSIKFTRNCTKAAIEIGSLEQAGETVLYVRDNGAGFDMKHSGKLFRPFQRLHHPDQFEGTGIGLALVQRIVLKHGGRIWAEAAVNHGAVFYFTLSGTAPDDELVEQ